MKKILIFVLLNFIITQNIITTKEYSLYKSNETLSIDFSEIIHEMTGQYTVDIVGVNDLNFNKTKKVIVQPCELKFSISSNLSNDDMDISLCDQKYYFKNKLIINDTNTSIQINHEKYNHLSCSLIFWVTGKFDIIN